MRADDRLAGLVQSNIGTGCYGFRFDRTLVGNRVNTVSDLILFFGSTNILLTVGEGGAIVGKRLFAGARSLCQALDDTDNVATIEHEDSSTPRKLEQPDHTMATNGGRLWV